MKNSHVWCCNVADLIQHFFQVLYIKNKSRTAANSRGCRVLRECWYLPVDELKNLEKSGEIYTAKPFSGLRDFKWLLWLLGHHFKQYLRCVCWFLPSDLSPATVLATPWWDWGGEEQSQVTDSETETQRGGHCPQAMQEVGVGEQSSHGSWALHNLIKLLPLSLSGEWVILSAEAAQLMAILKLWPQWLLLLYLLKQFWLRSVLGDNFIPNKQQTQMPSAA